MSKTPTLSALSDHLADLVAAVGPSIVGVRGRRRFGTGIVWDAEHVVTTAHAVGRGSDVSLALPDGTSAPATVVGRDRATDLALLKTEAALPVAPAWSDAAGLAVGHLVVVLGRPGRAARATLGMVSAVSDEPWNTPLGGQVDRFLSVDANLPAGFSGGPLVDSTGAVVGLNTRGLIRGGTTLPTATVRRAVEAITERGDLRPGYLGVIIQPAERDGTPGLLVTGLAKDGPASRAGLQPGDLIVEVTGQATTSVEELAAALHGTADTDVSVVALSGGERIETTARVAERRRKAC